MTRASIAAGLPLLVSLIAVRLLTTAEQSAGDLVPVAVSAGVVILVIAAVLTAVVLMNRRRMVDARGRRKKLRDGGRDHWLGDVSIDSQSRAALGIVGLDRTHTFALVGAEDAVEVWGAASELKARVKWTELRGIESTPMSWTSDAGSAIVLFVGDSDVPILLDLVGPLFGTLPVTRGQQESVAGSLELGRSKAAI
jgi:hypothetical protein